jgi:hypothetical protein
MTKKLLFIVSFLCLCCTGGYGQSVEKLSASFTFPTTPVGVKQSGSIVNGGTSFFRASTLAANHGSITLEWSVVPSVRKGSIALYSVAGELVKKIDLIECSGKVSLNRVLPASGVFLATITFGSYKQTLKLALYR